MRMKKLLSMLLAMLLAVSLLPTAAFATEYNDGDEGGVKMSLTVEGAVQYTVNVSASPEYYGTVTGGGTYDEGASVTLTATPQKYCIFTGWLENGEKLENVGASYTFTASADRTLTAVFEQGRGLCGLMIYPSDYFTFSGEGEYCEGEMVTVTAVPKHAGVEFSAWWQDGVTPAVSNEASYSFNIFDDVRLEVAYQSVSAVNVGPGEGSGKAVLTNSLFANQIDEGHMFYTSEGLDDLKFHFPPADYFTAPEGKVFDCWEMKGVGYEAGAVQAVIGDGANPDFAGKDNVVTAKWKDDDSKTLKCVISIPAQVEIPYGQELTSVPWSVDSLELGAYQRVAVTFYDGLFRNQNNEVIRYSVKDIYDQDGSDSYIYKIRRPEEHTVQVCIPKDSWEVAAPGRYTATLRFEVEGIY